MQTVTVIATKDFTADDGRQVQSGDAVALIPIEAAVRGRAGEVSLDPGARTTYRTRDMNSAPVTAPVAAAPVHADVPQPKRRRRRTRKVIETS
jgi:hypothetical protein